MLISKKSARLRLPWLPMQPAPARQMLSYCIGCGVTFTSVFDGAAPVIPPAAFVGNTTCDMKTFHFWPLLPLGSRFLSEPYQPASARPGPPALSQGKTFTASPVAVDPSLTCTGGVQTLQPVAAEAALPKTCRCPGFALPASSTQVTKRLRAVSIEATVNSTSGPSGRLSATWISFE